MHVFPCKFNEQNFLHGITYYYNSALVSYKNLVVAVNLRNNFSDVYGICAVLNLLKMCN